MNLPWGRDRLYRWGPSGEDLYIEQYKLGQAHGLDHLKEDLKNKNFEISEKKPILRMFMIFVRSEMVFEVKLRGPYESVPQCPYYPLK